MTPLLVKFGIRISGRPGAWIPGNEPLPEGAVYVGIAPSKHPAGVGAEYLGI